ncbi:MADS-box protein AGL24-like [Argentina anserina]|uniref:MADS-box protein AGL24-like n=1 Tax=Argentina anserina TaxID=57926 RepID=UPI0021762AD6|nr:MADS-box protein AGL24-like [Potentilla anserina]
MEQRRARKKMYRDRKMNIFKKADELSILCDTDVAVILFQPADESTTAQPVAETWPKDPTEFKCISADTRISKEDRGKKKLRVDNDENINSEEAMRMQYEFHTNGHAAGKDELYKRDNEFRIGYDDLELAKLASLEARRDAITKRIASLEAAPACIPTPVLYHFI